MSNNWDIPEHISVPINADADGFTGRECPQKECEGYFKVEFGTGLKGKGLPCHCPYCDYTASHDHFWTKEQIEYAKSVAMREIGQSIRKELKKLEFNYPARGMFGIGLSMKLKPSAPLPLRYYREKQLETEVICDECTLRYAIYGVFANCPDCGSHNSLQILMKNLELAIKELELSMQVDSPDLKQHLINDSLENVVSAFDGFGREITKVNASKSTNPEKAQNISFQNLLKAQKSLQMHFNYDLTSAISSSEWGLSLKCFNKRHLLAHKMGVVDQKYIDATNDYTVKAGRKVVIGLDEVQDLIKVITKLGTSLLKGVS